MGEQVRMYILYIGRAEDGAVSGAEFARDSARK